MPPDHVEAWLTGPPSDVDKVLAALGEIGHVAFTTPPQRMFGTDAGRVHRYIRVISVTATVAPPRPTRRRESAGQAVIDLDTERAKRTA